MLTTAEVTRVIADAFLREAMRTLAFVFAAFIAATGFSEELTVEPERWLELRPSTVVWSSRGTAKILEDNSVQLESSDGWQEFTIYFRPPRRFQIQSVRLELFPATPPSTSIRNVQLFDVKPHLMNETTGGSTQLEFKIARFVGAPNDDTVANCIDFLSDTGWKIPEFDAGNRPHQLVMQHDRPIMMNESQEYGLTIDSGGAPELGTLSRIRLSFSSVDSMAVDKNDDAGNHSKQSHSKQSRGN